MCKIFKISFLDKLKEAAFLGIHCKYEPWFFMPNWNNDDDDDDDDHNNNNNNNSFSLQTKILKRYVVL